MRRLMARETSTVPVQFLDLPPRQTLSQDHCLRISPMFALDRGEKAQHTRGHLSPCLGTRIPTHKRHRHGRRQPIHWKYCRLLPQCLTAKTCMYDRAGVEKVAGRCRRKWTNKRGGEGARVAVRCTGMIPVLPCNPDRQLPPSKRLLLWPWPTAGSEL